MWIQTIVLEDGLQHLQEEIKRHGAATEVDANKLIQCGIKLLSAPYLEPLFRAGTTVFIDVLDTLYHELILVRDHVLEGGEIIRSLYGQLHAILKDTSLIPDRLKARESIVSGVVWSDLTGFVSPTRAAVHAAMVDDIREKNLSSPNDVIGPIVFAVRGVFDCMTSNFGDYLEGGVLHPDNLTSEQLFVLTKCKVLNHNMPAEQFFGVTDGIFSRLGCVSGTHIVGGLAQGSSKDNDAMGRLGRLSKEDQDKFTEQAISKRPWLVQQHKDMKDARKTVQAQKKADAVKQGDTKCDNRVKKAYEIQQRSDARPLSSAAIDAAIEPLTRPQTLVYIKAVLQIYRSPIWTGRLVKESSGAAPVLLTAVRTAAGNKLTTLSKDKVDVPIATLIENAKRLTELTTGMAPLSVEEANVAGILPRDTRIVRPLTPAEAAAKAEENPTLQKLRSGKEANRNRSNGTRDRIKQANNLVVWRSTLCRATMRTFYWHVGERKPQWDHPGAGVEVKIVCAHEARV
jgi:hypothetical protein